MDGSDVVQHGAFRSFVVSRKVGEFERHARKNMSQMLQTVVVMNVTGDLFPPIRYEETSLSLQVYFLVCSQV